MEYTIEEDWQGNTIEVRKDIVAEARAEKDRFVRDKARQKDAKKSGDYKRQSRRRVQEDCQNLPRRAAPLATVVLMVDVAMDIAEVDIVNIGKSSIL